MSTGEYLNEEKYQKNKRALVTASVIIAIIGVLVGGGLIAGGIIKNSSVSQVDTSMPTYSMNMDFNEAVKQDNAWINEVGKRNDEQMAAFGMIGGGVFILFTSLIAAGFILFVAKRREIMAFQVQQVAPVAKEGIEKATPVVSKAAGSIAKEISKGIKEGKAEDKEKEPKE